MWKQKFILFSLLIALAEVSGTMALVKYFAGIIGSMEVPALLCCFFIAIISTVLYIVVSSWIHNISHLLFFKIKTYNISMINLYPILYIKENKTKMKVFWQLSTLMNTYTCINLIALKNEEEIDNYIENYRNYIKVELFLKHVFMTFFCLIIAFKLIFVSLFFMFASLAVTMLYFTEPGKYMDGGMYINGMRKGREYWLLHSVSNERGDKKEIYKYLQEKVPYCDSDAVARKVITDMLINSIADNRSYVTSDIEQILYNEFFGDSMEQKLLDDDILLKLRLIHTYYQYLCFFRGDRIDKEVIKLRWRRIKLKNSEYEYWRKAIAAATEPDKNDINKCYEYYREAIKKVY